MDHFVRRGADLYAEDVPLSHIADTVGTPCYVYSAATIRRHLSVFSQGFAGTDHLVAFAVKSCSALAVLQLLARDGAGADIVSGGEMRRALTAGVPAVRIVFSGVGKTAAELADALDARVGQINVESIEELRELSQIAASRNEKAPVALRINPNVDAGTHDKISTGRADDKFGIPYTHALDAYREAMTLPGIDIRGVAMHIGSQITQLSPFQAAIAAMIDLTRTLRRNGISITTFDVGGGLGIPYASTQEQPPSPDAYARLVREMVSPLGVKTILEPGRLIVGNAGVLLTRIIRTKSQISRRFVIVDSGMNDLIRPALYGARHETVAVTERSGDVAPFDIVGPVCESTDIFDRDVGLVDPQAGDLLALRTAGAYGAVQASQYNTRALVPEVLVDGEQVHIIRRRPTYEEMFALETLLPDTE